MNNFSRSPWAFAVGGFFLLAPTSAFAQGISGEVTDNTGGILPGVTVTAASPALIEGERIAITDSQGLYAIVALEPGLYSVTFTLPGFNTIIREGIELTTGFTANIDSAMGVGGIEETITVTGAAPVVDVQNVRRQTAVTAEVLSTLPLSTKHVNNLVTLTPGFTGLADVGGRYSSQVGGEYHGKSGTKVAMDGMGVENSFGNSSYQINAAAVSEMVLQTTGISADTNADGAVVNVIPKEGGNTFSGILAGFYAGDAMESQNLTQELKDAGLTTSNSTLKLWDQSLSIGGPVARDRLWFFIAGRSWGFSRAHAGVYWNQNTFPGAPPTGEPRYLTPSGSGSQGGELHPVRVDAAQPLQRPAGVVRLVPEPAHLAGGDQPQVQHHLRRATRLQLRLHQRQQDAGVGAGLSLRPEPADAVHVDVDADEPPAAGSRRDDRDLAVEHLPDAGASKRMKY